MAETKTTTVEMKPQSEKKFTYEELNDIASQLSQQNQQLYQQLQRANMNNMFKRLDYLFKVVENGHMFNSEFLDKCISEIEDTITVEEDSTQDNKEEK